MEIALPASWADALENTPIVRDWTAAEVRHGLLRWLPRRWVREGVVLDQYIREGRFQPSLALIAGGSALLGGLEVSYEHVIGSYSQRVMYSPVFLSGAVAAAGGCRCTTSSWGRRCSRRCC